MRVAAVADIHSRSFHETALEELFNSIKNNADILLLPGDLTDNGQPAEIEMLLQYLEPLIMPVIAVLGNHDHENGKAPEIQQLLEDNEVYVLNGTAVELDGVGFVGTKGFAGGFHSTMVQPFGENALKAFIQTGIDEAMALENAVAKLHCEKKVAVLHYSPIPDTLVGEPLQLYPFLGSSRLESALERQRVDFIVHGHAHHGSPEGYTRGEIPVYNVSRFVQKAHLDRWYCTVDI